jgi:seryl-tRNA synthetase
MIDLKDLREQPEKYRQGAADKQIGVDIDRLLELDKQLRAAMTRQQEITAERNKLNKQIGPLMGQLKKAEGEEKGRLEAQLTQLKAEPARLKDEEERLRQQVAELEAERQPLWLQVPQPPDPDVPKGESADQNVELRRWNPPGFDTAKSFRENRGFDPKPHTELMPKLGMFDAERGVKMAGTRSYVLKGAGMRLHQAVLRCAFDMMVNEQGFTPISVPVLVREPVMVGTGFFPHGKEQAYEVAETTRGGGHDLYLTGTGEVGLMGLHMDEILEAETLPRRYVTVSTCFRREAGAAGKDTAGVYRVHQFDKVEQVVICQADEQLSRQWHQKMMGFVETLLQRLELPYRLLQCCTGDLGPKNADQVDIEAWMPGRGEPDANGAPSGEYGETHSASRIYDYQCRRLNLRYRDPETKKPVIAHALNNTVAASPRLLVPIVEMYQNEDGSVTVPGLLRPYMGGLENITAG